jgi:hypothetical protein
LACFRLLGSAAVVPLHFPARRIAGRSKMINQLTGYSGESAGDGDLFFGGTISVTTIFRINGWHQFTIA